MKKIMMIAVMAVAAISANAQMWVGGNLGFNTEKTKFEDTELSSGTSFEIAPEVGYNLNEKWAVAIALGYGHYDAGTVTFAGKEVSGIINTFSIKPYVRYTFVKAGNFSAFCDGVLDYSTTHVNGVENNRNSWGLAVTPGIAYAISPKVSLVAHVGEIGYDHTWFDAGVGDVTNNKFGINLTNAISFGAYVNL